MDRVSRSNRTITLTVWPICVLLMGGANRTQQPPDPPAFDTRLNQPLTSGPSYPWSGSPTAANPGWGPPPAAGAGGFAPSSSPGLPMRDPAYRLPPSGPADPRMAPGVNPDPSAAGQQFQAQVDMPPLKVFAPGQIIAWVGDQPIQVGDVMPMVEQMLAPHLAKLSAEQLRESQKQIEQQKQTLLKQALNSAVETKLMYLEFLRSVPADKRKEVLPRINKKAEEQFAEKQLPDAMKKANVSSPGELDNKLREFGSSLAKQKQGFLERALGQSVLGQKINYEPEITHQDMLNYYHEHSAEYDRPAQVRWEKLSVRFDRYPNKAAAWEAVGALGAEVWKGVKLAEVAQHSSQGADASDGGYHDWTNQGSLASEVLDHAIFTLPVGQLSERLEDERELHIIRVIERREATRVSFVDAQVDIKETLRKQKIKEQVQTYIAHLKQTSYVWTIYDEPRPDAQNVAMPPDAAPLLR